MRRLPERPNLDQLRRQARELQRAAHAGDPSAIRRLRRVSNTTSLTSAQLALARDYGFSSWAQLKAEVDQRRAQPRTPAPSPGRTVRRTWQEMLEWMASLLEKRTGQKVEEWRQRIARHRFPDEPALRRWLTDQGVTDYGQTLLVWERFGYPSHMTAGFDDLIGRQYADRPQLKPVLDAILSALPDVGPDIILQARKTYLSLVSKRRTFAVIQPTTKRRIDLGLRLADVKANGRLEPARRVGNGSMTVKLSLASPSDLDAEALRWLKGAFEQNA